MAREPTTEQTQFENLAFRYSNYDTPFWARPNSDSGRWHQAGEGSIQYLSTTVDGAWAELVRAEGLRSEPEISLVRMPMWVAEVHLQRIADYETFDKASDAGFPAEALIEDDYNRCQEEGKRLREAGFQGVIAPSAALPGALNLTLFGSRIASSWGVRPLLVSSIPATKLAVGAPPEGVVERVRHVGEVHTLYEDFRVKLRTSRKSRKKDR